MTTKLAISKAAQAWCKPTTEHLEMIPELAEAFAEIIDELWTESSPGFAYMRLEQLTREILATLSVEGNAKEPIVKLYPVLEIWKSTFAEITRGRFDD